MAEVSRSLAVSTHTNIDRGLKLYSAAAIAAGVGMLALAQPAESEVVITHVKIPITNVGGPVQIDINGDGINDFSFSMYSFAYHSFRATLNVTPLAGAAVQASTFRNAGYATALPWGAVISPSLNFDSHAARVERLNGNAYPPFGRCTVGLWGGNPTFARYLGVKFLINGQTHFGWVRLNVATSPGLTATIVAYGYETVANKNIRAGSLKGAALAREDADASQVSKPAVGPSLGMLALGADGLKMWRPQEAQAKACRASSL
jgi:hypothetical protein